MRCVIARYPFELTKSGVPASMKGVTPDESAPAVAPTPLQTARTPLGGTASTEG